MTHIRVLVPVTSTIRNVDDLQTLAQPGLTISGAAITAGPPSIESRVDEAFCVPGLISLALQAQRDGVDALVIDCMGDPGLGALREAVQIPVLGVAQTSMSVASLLAQRFGIVTVLDRITTLMNELAELYGYERQYVGCHSIAVPVLNIHDDMAKVQADLGEAAVRLVEEKQAAAILLGCTGFFGCAEAMRKRLAAAGHFVPVIDPVPTTVSIAAALVRNGLAHSQVSYPPFEAAKQIVGFESFFSQR